MATRSDSNSDGLALRTTPSQLPWQLLLNTLESISDAFFLLDQDWRFTYLNPQACRVLNRLVSDLLNKNVWDEFPEAVGSLFEQEYRRATAEQITVSFESFYPPLNCWFAVRAYPIESGLAVYFQDVTDQKNAQAALQQQEQTAQQRLSEIEAIYATAPVGLCFNDTDLRFVRINEQLAEINGATVEQHIGRTVREMLPELADQLEPIYHQVIDTGEPIINLEVTGTNPAQPGIVRDWLASYYPLQSGDGRILGVNVVVQEITELKRREAERQHAEVALRRSEERYRTLFESIDEGFCIIEVLFDDQDRAIDYRFLETNPTFEAQTGLTQAIGKTMRELVPDIENHWIEMYENVVKTGESIRFEDYSEAMHRWFDAYAFRTEEPASRKVAILFNDITERKLSDTALQESEARFRRMTDVLPQILWTADPDGTIDYYNQYWEDYTGASRVGTSNWEWQQILHSEDQQGTAEAWRQTLREERSLHEYEHRVKRKDGQYRWHLTRAVPYRDEQGQIVKWFGLAIDIHEQKLAIEQRDRGLQREQAAREEAERANRIKDEFLAVLSHELRSPLNPILGWTKLLQSGRLDPAKSVGALATIERNAKLQSQLIEDLLDISRIMRGKLVLNREPTNLTEVIAAATETVQLAADAKQIQLSTQFDSNVGFVFGEAGRLQQVVWNLLSNAVKFTPEGGQIQVQLSQIGQQVQLQVIDTGKGISPNFLPHVFEYFRQEDGSTTRKFGGLGLGLAIARQIVEMHGGTISASSSGEGQGATFTVQIPLLKSTCVAPQSICSSASSSSDFMSLAGVRALVVDDDPDAREFLTFLLRMYGAIVTTVASAAEVLQAIEQSPPDILLSDIGMPDIDGYTLMRMIRGSEHARSIPAIALTAYAGEFDQRQAIAAGFQRHIAKPIDPDRVIAIVVELVR